MLLHIGFAITRTLFNRMSALDEVLRILCDPSRGEAEKKWLRRDAPDPSDPRDLYQDEELPEAEREPSAGSCAEPAVSVSRETSEWRTHEDESTDARRRGGRP